MGTSVEDYDDFPPCFFESAEEEFYDAPAPNEDIWKKFELLPTPPRSPKHETIFSSSMSMIVPSTLDKLRVVSEMLDDPISKTALALSEVCPAKCTDACCNFNSKLIHDCMWSGHNVPQEFKRGQSASGGSQPRVRSCSFSLTVDPNVAAVFPYPVNDQTRQVQRESSIGAETPSDSDDDESSEEDEEIDVVTVTGRTMTPSRPVLPPAPKSPNAQACAQVAAMHNYTATSPRSPKSDLGGCPSSNSVGGSRACLVQKRPRHYHHHHVPSKKAKFMLSSTKFSMNSPSSSSSSSSEIRTVTYQRLSRGSSRCSSDSEDSDGRRAQHNVLERKRRNDLKSSFHRLRYAVPDLQAQERAAKVTILKKAADHILNLRLAHQTLTTEYDRQRRTNEALQRRLRQLRSK